MPYTEVCLLLVDISRPLETVLDDDGIFRQGHESRMSITGDIVNLSHNS